MFSSIDLYVCFVILCYWKASRNTVFQTHSVIIFSSYYPCPLHMNHNLLYTKSENPRRTDTKWNVGVAFSEFEDLRMHLSQFLDNSIFTQIWQFVAEMQKKIVYVIHFGTTHLEFWKWTSTNHIKTFSQRKWPRKSENKTPQVLWRELLFICSTFFNLKADFQTGQKKKHNSG